MSEEDLDKKIDTFLFNLKCLFDTEFYNWYCRVDTRKKLIGELKEIIKEI